MRSLVGLCLCLGLLLSGSEGFSITWPKWGRCPNMSVEQEFELKSYVGTWFVQAGYNLAMTQGAGRCASGTYSLDPSRDNVVDVTNKQISARTNKWESISGYAVPDDPAKDEGKFTVSLYLWGFWKVTGPYWVLGTDYYSYSVVYGCENFLYLFHYDSSWLLSGVQQLDSYQSKRFYRHVNSVLEKHNMDPDVFEKVSQEDCDV